MMVLIKAYKKYSAANIKSRTWSGGQTWLLILVGLFPVMLLSCVIWYFSRDFHNIVGIQGLFKGIAFSWLLYLLFMVLAHLVSPWRNEIQ
jgi:hypothetical protein